MNNNQTQTNTQTNQNTQPILKSKPQRQLRELLGKITDKVKSKVYSHKRECLPNKCQPNCHYGELCYKLQIACENRPEINQIMVFKDMLTTEQIWKDIEAVSYYNKIYAFSCNQWMKIYRLVDWKEIGNPTLESKKETKKK